MNNLINVSEIIDQQSVGLFQIKVMILGTLLIFLDGFDVQALAFVAPTLKTAWHLSPGALGPVFSLSIIGVALGSLVGGVLADRFGRRGVLLGCIFFSALLSVIIAQMSSVFGLSVARLIIGLSLGALMPLSIVLTNEFAPLHRRATMVTITTCGYAIGAASGGFLAAHIVRLYGWQSMFYAGAGIAIVLGLISVIEMPESIRFLALRSGSRNEILRIVRRINPALTFAPDVHFVGKSGTKTTPKFMPIRNLEELFTKNRRWLTVSLWVSMLMGYMVLNFLNSWLPSLLTDAGMLKAVALRTSTALQFGGLTGVIIMGILADRFGYYRVLTTCFVIGGVFTIGIGLVGTSVTALIVPIFFAGVGSIGCNLVLGALSATLYPTRIRASGSSWAFGVARLASMVSPLIGGYVISLGWPLEKIFLVFSIPMFIGALGVVAIAFIARRSDIEQLEVLGKMEIVPESDKYVVDQKG